VHDSVGHIVQIPKAHIDESHIAVGPPPADTVRRRNRCRGRAAAMTTPDLRDGAASPAPITTVERHGVERIPDAERDARPLDLFRLTFGGANTFATAFLGSFPILFGLSFWQGLTAMVLGSWSVR
jgi:hypothetical protein